MKTKECQNLREACHEPIGANPFDLCDSCLYFDAILAKNSIAKELESGEPSRTSISFDLQEIFKYFTYCDLTKEQIVKGVYLTAKLEFMTDEGRPCAYELLKLEEILGQANQPSVSDILNLPF